jgi:hypothetical protein
MKLDKFIKQLELAYEQPTVYMKGGWGKWNGSKWGFDCICYIKAILWGWNNDKSKPRGGGAVYASNGVPDIGTEQMIGVCHDVSSDFKDISIGEIVWMQGHVGVYIGNGNVLEATTGWKTKKVIKSQINRNGARTYNGKTGSKPWQKHGFLPYVDYNYTPSEDKIELPPRGYFKKGDKGDDVRKIDQWLYEKYGNKKVLGNLYGTNTVSEVKKFQKEAKAKGLYTGKNATIDGKTGPLTLKAMRECGFKY